MSGSNQTCCTSGLERSLLEGGLSVGPDKEASVWGVNPKDVPGNSIGWHALLGVGSHCRSHSVSGETQ